MSIQQPDGATPSVPPPQTSNFQAVNNIVKNDPTQLLSTALRALPSLPHPALLSSITPGIALDLKRQMEHLRKLADKISQKNGLGESPPLPPQTSSLLPIPAIPIPPAQNTKVPSSTAVQTLRTRIKRQPKPSGRYLLYEAADEESNGETLEDVSSLSKIVDRFNAIQEQDEAESSAMGAARARMCELSLETSTVGTNDVLRVAWGVTGREDSGDDSRKRRKTAHADLYARIRLRSAAEADDHRQHQHPVIITLAREVREMQLSKISSFSPSSSGPTLILSELLTSQHLTLAETLDRLPSLPSLLSSPCVFCASFIRPPDGLPLQGIGFLPDPKLPRRRAAGPEAKVEKVHARGTDEKAPLDDGGAGSKGTEQGEGGGTEGHGDQDKKEDGEEEHHVGQEGRGDVARHAPSGRWVNWHASCDV